MKKQLPLPDPYWCVKGHKNCIVHSAKLTIKPDKTIISKQYGVR